VDLDADEALELAVWGVVVDDLGHDVAVEDVDQQVAADDEVVPVPVVGMDEGLEVVRGAEGGDDGRAFAGGNVGDLAAHGKEGAAALLVVLAGVLVGTVDVGLVAAEEPFGSGNLDAAVVDAGVALVGDAEVDLEFEVFGRAAAPDEEAVLLEEIVRGDFADEDFVFDAPVLGVTIPVFEGAVEDGLEPSSVSVRGCG
jgi:hypothetical protein